MKSNGASRLLGRWNGELHISKSFRRSIRLYVATGIIFASCLPSSTLFAVQLQPGDILVTTDIGTAASPDPAILLIDPVTGDRTVISDNSHGAGTTFVPPVPPDDQMFAGLTYMTWQSDGSLLVSEEGTVSPTSGPPITRIDALFRVDPTTGDRTVISTAANSGPFAPYSAAHDFGSGVLVAGGNSLLDVDSTTGNRTLVSGPGRGSGPALISATGLAISGTNVFVQDPGKIIEIDTTTGNRSVVASAFVGTGPPIAGYDVTLDPAGLLVSNVPQGNLLQLDPATGNRTIVSGGAVGTGPAMEPISLAFTDSGSYIVTSATNSVLEVDPATGNRTILSDDAHGTGPWATYVMGPTAVVVVPNVPEPSTIVLGALGVALLLVRRWRRIASLAVALVPVLAPLAASAQVTINWSPVGNPGNAADLTTGSLYGAVPYSYNIGTYDVTVAQYVDFLNSNDPTAANTLGLYNSDMATSSGISNHGAGNGNRYFYTNTGPDPVTNVTWYDAIRFANWLDNGQVPGSTETGAYTLGPLEAGGVPINGHSITRNAGATVFLPSENEWYKAAYYNPAANPATYYQYPTSSNTVPTASGPTATPNSANYNSVDTVTPVGAYIETTSPYGAFDMGGNVDQWNETFMSGSSRGARGGSFNDNAPFLQSSHKLMLNPLSEIFVLGFRVANYPAPTLPGDVNFDGVVNGLDIADVSSNWLHAGFATAGDANHDGVVNGLDIALISANWLRTSGGRAGVPEPSTLILATLGGLAFLAYRWRIA